MSIPSDPPVQGSNSTHVSSHQVESSTEKYNFLKKYFELYNDGSRKEREPCSTYCQQAVDLEACVKDCEFFKRLCQWHRNN